MKESTYNYKKGYAMTMYHFEHISRYDISLEDEPVVSCGYAGPVDAHIDRSGFGVLDCPKCGDTMEIEEERIVGMSDNDNGWPIAYLGGAMQWREIIQYKLYAEQSC